MHSSIVQDREEAAKELLTTLQLHGKRVGVRLAEVFTPLLEEGETLPDYVLLQQLMARSIRTRLSNLLAADKAHLSVADQLEGEDARQGEQGIAPEARSRNTFLHGRLARTENERLEAMAAFDESYTGFSRMLEALYGLAGEDEIAERLRPRPLASDAGQPEPLLAEDEISDVSEEDADPVQRRILSRKGRRSGLSQWMGVRIFRLRRRG